MKVSVPAEAKHRYDAWQNQRDDFAQLLCSNPVVSEPDVEFSPRSIEERLVQVIWNDQLLKINQLTTASGKSVEILEPGRWNTGRGPDFFQARLRIAGREVRGDIEIHTTTSDWYHHQHDQDFAYNAVALHVCLCAGDDRPYDEKQNGERLERLIIEHVLDPDLETIQRTINVDEYPHGKPVSLGKCHRQFSQLPATRLHDFFLTAGKCRIEDKIQRFTQQAATAPLSQVFYQAMMTSAGYKSNKTLYFLLSKRAPLSELFDYAQDLKTEDRPTFFLSVMLNVSSLLPSSELISSMDEDAQAFAIEMARHWKPFRGYFSDRHLPPTKRWFAGMRPQGFPLRRLAAIAELLVRFSDSKNELFGNLTHLFQSETPVGGTEKDWRSFFKKLVKLITVESSESYPSTHYTVGGKAVAPQALLGEPAAKTLLFNVVFPMMILQSRISKAKELESNVWQALNLFPALPSNSVTKMMRQRLFADSGVEKSLIKREMSQQALYKIFQDCCSWNEHSCNDCTFFQSPLAQKS